MITCNNLAFDLTYGQLFQYTLYAANHKALWFIVKINNNHVFYYEVVICDDAFNFYI